MAIMPIGLVLCITSLDFFIVHLTFECLLFYVIHLIGFLTSTNPAEGIILQLDRDCLTHCLWHTGVITYNILSESKLVVVRNCFCDLIANTFVAFRFYAYQLKILLLSCRRSTQLNTTSQCHIGSTSQYFFLLHLQIRICG